MINEPGSKGQFNFITSSTPNFLRYFTKFHKEDLKGSHS